MSACSSSLATPFSVEISDYFHHTETIICPSLSWRGSFPSSLRWKLVEELCWFNKVLPQVSTSHKGLGGEAACWSPYNNTGVRRVNGDSFSVSICTSCCNGDVFSPHQNEFQLNSIIDVDKLGWGGEMVQLFTAWLPLILTKMMLSSLDCCSGTDLPCR